LIREPPTDGVDRPILENSYSVADIWNSLCHGISMFLFCPRTDVTYSFRCKWSYLDLFRSMCPYRRIESTWLLTHQFIRHSFTRSRQA